MTQRTSPDWLTQYTFAHRGLHGGLSGQSNECAVPENTRAAVRAAIDRGLAIECDVQVSSDGTPMVFHDFDLDRLTAAIGPVAERSAAELCELQIQGTDQQIWTLADLFDEVAGQVPILIEVKSLAALSDEDICRISSACWGKSAGYLGAFAVMSFDPRVPEWFALHAPQVVRGLVGTDTLKNGFEGAWHGSSALSRAKADFLAVDLRDIEASSAADWRADGRPLLTWTVRTAEDRSRAEKLADALIAEGDGVL